MSDHISTEEAERVANALNRFTFEMPSYPECERARVEAMSALRALAAERDALNKALALKADDAYRAGYAAGYPEGFAAALWEEDR